MSKKDHIDLVEKNVLGGLDRFVTNIALAVVAVFPTFAVGIFQPWKLAPLLEADEPEGRRGALLSPGVFFVIGLTVVLILVAAVSTEETLAWNGSLIGPDWAVSVASAAGEGNIWKTVSKITPVFLLAILWGVVGVSLKKWAGSGWTFAVSIRAAFYVITILISYLILISAAFDFVTVHLERPEITRLVYNILPPTIPLYILWTYFWFFRAGENVSAKKAAVLSSSMLAILAALFFGASLILFSG